MQSLGYSLAFDDSHEVDEELHWHEFDSVAIVISGSGSFADETGAVTQVQPGCMVTAEAGWLHRTLAGTQTRVVLGSNMPYEEGAIQSTSRQSRNCSSQSTFDERRAQTEL